MPRRKSEPSVEEPSCSRKKLSVSSNLIPAIDIKSGEILIDLTGKKWRIGRTVGTGGFGEIFLASNDITSEVTADSQYVAKVETHTNGPLFVEINCYLRIAKKDSIDKWKKENNVTALGMPHYVASGSHTSKGIKYRFLIIPRFEKDLEQIFESKKRKFNLKTVLSVALQLLDTLEYIHSKGYVHSDIKASNILLKKGDTPKENRTTYPFGSTIVRYSGTAPLRACRVKKLTLTRCLRPNINLRYLTNIEFVDNVECNARAKNSDQDQVYLLDFGLASRYLQGNGEHKEFCTDERKAHAGTILFCSLDAHKGAQSRRSDLETLGYNIIYWLTSNLPWMTDTEEPHIVHKKKQKCLSNLDEFFTICFIDPYPKFLYDYFKYLAELDFETEPDYAYCRNLFKKTLIEYRYKDNSRFDFDNLEGWGSKQKKFKRNSENKRTFKNVSYRLNRVPLTSNLPVKPALRRKRKNKKIVKLNWSRILIDPEIILKQAKTRDRKLTESSDPGPGVLNLDIHQLNPTYAMLEVYNKSLERANSGSSPKYKGDGCTDHIESYTSAMMAVYNRKKERDEIELEKMVVNNSKSSNKTSGKSVAGSRKRTLIKAKKSGSSKTRNTKSLQEVKKENPRKVRHVTSTRSHRLRG